MADAGGAGGPTEAELAAFSPAAQTFIKFVLARMDRLRRSAAMWDGQVVRPTEWERPVLNGPHLTDGPIATLFRGYFTLLESKVVPFDVEPLVDVIRGMDETESRAFVLRFYETVTTMYMAINNGNFTRYAPVYRAVVTRTPEMRHYVARDVFSGYPVLHAGKLMSDPVEVASLMGLPVSTSMLAAIHCIVRHQLLAVIHDAYLAHMIDAIRENAAADHMQVYNEQVVTDMKQMHELFHSYKFGPLVMTAIMNLYGLDGGIYRVTPPDVDRLRLDRTTPETAAENVRRGILLRHTHLTPYADRRIRQLLHAVVPWMHMTFGYAWFVYDDRCNRLVGHAIDMHNELVAEKTKKALEEALHADLANVVAQFAHLGGTVAFPLTRAMASDSEDDDSEDENPSKRARA